MVLNSDLTPKYTDSRALVIGINKYEKLSPLGYAINDAEGIAEMLINKFDFSKENVCLLLDKEATRKAVMKSFMSFTSKDVNKDDRILVFFAGHGHTCSGRRGEAGFLVPYDGDFEDLSTLIRWNELTGNSDLILAKHMLFIMDACYGGLAITRDPSSGSTRSLRDILLRPVRQVLTAGKADEKVADSGGPIPNHSVFTGHLLQALDGKAATENGVITANGVMYYVYKQVSEDKDSKQTPHYGFLDGDGDFIFHAPELNKLKKEEKVDSGLLSKIPEPKPETHIEADIVNKTKKYLSDSNKIILLDDFVTLYAREVLIETADEKFPVQGPFSDEELSSRLKRYETIIQDLQSIITCIAHWGDNQHQPIFAKAIARMTDHLESQAGLEDWMNLKWYPVIILMYSAGIAALSSKKYENLFTLFMTKVHSPSSSGEKTELILATGEAILAIERRDLFKRLPGHERNYVPRSEYLFKLLQPKLDDLLFLGRDYEQFFDDFEVLMALVHAELYSYKKHIWGPVGRFGWKYNRRFHSDNPLERIFIEAEQQKNEWLPLVAGFFGGKYERFKQITEEYSKHIAKLGWW